MTGSSGTTGYRLQEFTPEWAVSPGHLIQRELDAGGFSQTDVASRTNLSTKHLNQVLKGHVPLSPDVGLALERVLGVPAELWLRMDVSWQAHRAREIAQKSFAAMGSWVHKFPLSVLRSSGVIDAATSASVQVEKLLRFFQVADTEAFDRVWLEPQASYKRSQKFEIDPYATALWLRLAEVEAELSLGDTPAFNAGKLRDVAPTLPMLTREPLKKGFRHAQKELRKAGVLLVFIPEVEGTRICGASRWLGTGHPIIALSGRHKFHDIFWFTLLHEAGHILLHPKRATYINVEKKRGVHDDEDSLESSADQFAESLLLTERDRRELAEIDTAEDLTAFAERVGLAVGVVAGQYAHLTNDWKKFGKWRVSGEISVDLAG